jgi:hypothetical protein
MLGFALLTSVWAPQAHAFCGTYVGEAGVDLYNHASQVLMVRQDGRTTLNLASDFEGDLSSFALVVPVPSVLVQSDVSVVDPALITGIQAYSSPRLVKYTCEDFKWEYRNGGDTGALLDDSSSEVESGEDAAGSVQVEAEFSVGEYDIVVLSAEQSAGLLDWLEANGYAVDLAAASLLQDYIDAGTYFMAAKVNLGAIPDGQTYLRPLQFSYESEAFSLPIRLGTVNSAGSQDLLLYVLSTRDQGRTGISNYSEVTVEDECMAVLPDGGLGSDFGDFFNQGFDAPRAGMDRAGWTVEYGWSPYHCDPCSGDPPETEDLVALGWVGEREDSYLTRIHMRYGPDQVDQDLMLYGSGDTENTQLRFILYDPYLEDRFPVCGEGMVENPGSCAEYFDDGETVIQSDPDPESESEPGRFGCGAPLLPALAPAFLALVGVGRRRRKD